MQILNASQIAKLVSLTFDICKLPTAESHVSRGFESTKYNEKDLSQIRCLFPNGSVTRKWHFCHNLLIFVSSDSQNEMIAKRLIATDIHFFCFFMFFSKPMMDLLVMLCAKYHLNPSGHTIELITTNRNCVKFKPNALIGALEPEKILLKPKGMEDKSKKTGPRCLRYVLQQH